MRVNYAHIIDIWWNWSKMDQIIGRAIRFCSHKDLSIKNRIVSVFFYISIDYNNKKLIDHHILNIANKKLLINKTFEKILIDNAIDKKLFNNIK